MNIQLITSYPKLNEEGKRKLDKHDEPVIVFKYRVTGSKQELEDYANAMKDEDGKAITHRDTNGDYVWFTTRPVGLRGKLCISTNNKVYADTTAQDLAQSLLKQYPGALGTMLAKDVLNAGHTAPKQLDTDEPIEKESGLDKQ